MEIEDSSVPYRAFLRSGSYPALSQRVVRSGGVLVRAAGWFALVICAASAGYNTTQRMVTPSAAEPSEPAHARIMQSALVANSSALHLAQENESGQELVEREPTTEAAPSLRRSSASSRAAMPSAGQASTPAAKKRPGAVVRQEVQPELLRHASSAIEGMPSPSEESRAEQIAERVRALDGASQAAPAREAGAASTLSEPIAAALRDSVERSRAASATRGDNDARMLAKSSAATTRVAAVTRITEPKASDSLPLSASATIDSLAVRGPLSAAHVRRSVERVRPTLSDCYSDAARRAGHNRFSPVRVQVTIDEAGRVKTSPKVDGAQLPGLGECLSSALSKLVCQAPDTGTARASITVGFAPQR